MQIVHEYNVDGGIGQATPVLDKTEMNAVYVTYELGSLKVTALFVARGEEIVCLTPDGSDVPEVMWYIARDQLLVAC